MFEYRDIDVKRDRAFLLSFHCRINYESETPYARRMGYEKYQEKWLSTPQPERYLSDLTESVKDERTIAELVMVDGEIAGYLWVTFREVPGYEVIIAEIMDIAVSPAYQRRGVGQQIMRRIENKARQAGATLLRSDTGVENTASQNLHRDMDFRTYKIHYEKVLIYEKPPQNIPPEKYTRAIEKGTNLLRRHGYDYPISADDLRRYAEADTFYPSAITWEEILEDELIVAHEIVEVAELKDMGLKIRKDVLLKNVNEVYEAHLKAAQVEVELAKKMRDYDHIQRRAKAFQSWTEDPLVPPELEDQYEQLYAKVNQVITSQKEGA